MSLKLFEAEGGCLHGTPTGSEAYRQEIVCGVTDSCRLGERLILKTMTTHLHRQTFVTSLLLHDCMTATMSSTNLPSSFDKDK